VQALSTLAHNAYLAFPAAGTLYQGPLKALCGPGLNCHSCPAAVLACPLGTLQHFLASVRHAVRWGTWRLGFYVVGTLLAMGLLGGRFACGWLCPFGWLQEGLHRVPSPKLRVPPGLDVLRYGVLALLVVGLPLLVANRLGHGEPWFCRVACPAGTLEAGGLFWLLPGLREQAGPVLAGKLGVLAAVLGWAVVSSRPYCRTLCPLGALYGLLNRWSLLQVEHDPSLCTRCGACADGCLAGLDPREGSSRSPRCLRCLECARVRCPNGALAVALGARRLSPTRCARPSTPAS